MIEFSYLCDLGFFFLQVMGCLETLTPLQPHGLL